MRPPRAYDLNARNSGRLSRRSDQSVARTKTQRRASMRPRLYGYVCPIHPEMRGTITVCRDRGHGSRGDAGEGCPR